MNKLDEIALRVEREVDKQFEGQGPSVNWIDTYRKNLIAELSKAAEPIDAWKPIETAPKDGKTFLITDGESVWIDHWDKRLERFFQHIDRYQPPKPTHWMPLPKPPAMSQGEQK